MELDHDPALDARDRADEQSSHARLYAALDGLCTDCKRYPAVTSGHCGYCTGRAMADKRNGLRGLADRGS